MTKSLYSKILLLVAILFFSQNIAFSQEAVDSLAVQKGEQIYKANCTSCHMMTDKVLIGPGLQGVTDRRAKDWLKKWINSSSDFIASGDADAIALYEEYNKVAMPSYYFEDADFEALFAYLKNPPIVEEVITADLSVADDQGNLITINQDDGSIIWKVNLKAEVLAPVAIDAKLIIVKTGSGELLGLDKSNGQILWSYRSKLPTLTIRGSSSPVIDANEIYVTFDNGRLGVFELDSGFPLWDGAISFAKGASELENIIDSDSNPVVEGGLVYTTNHFFSILLYN